MNSLHATIIAAVLFSTTTLCRAADESAYDPLQVSDSVSHAIEDLTIQDASRDRAIPIRVYFPAAQEAAPVLLFSHGLGGSRSGSSYLGKHWSGRGYVAVFLQHAGSDDSVWKDVPPRKRMLALKNAPSTANTLARFLDVPAVLDQLEKWNREADHPLAGRLDLENVGMSGHSYGAVTTQAVSGQSFGNRGKAFTDDRIDAALILSPSRPRRGDLKQSFKEVSVPWLLMTGTKDGSPIDSSLTPESRTEVFAAVPETVDKYQLVLHDGQHSAFSDGAARYERTKRNPNHHRLILALATAFWDSYLRNDTNARQWLQGEQARQLLEEKDVWQLQVQTSLEPQSKN